jgi:hypothetical protein
MKIMVTGFTTLPPRVQGFRSSKIQWFNDGIGFLASYITGFMALPPSVKKSEICLPANYGCRIAIIFK